MATSDMCGYCFDVLGNYLDKNINIHSPNFTNDPFPIFVTWRVDGDHLRLFYFIFI
jgi:hypothetical protein